MRSDYSVDDEQYTVVMSMQRPSRRPYVFEKLPDSARIALYHKRLVQAHIEV